MLGIVRFYDRTRGFGFIAPEDGGGDVFVHVSAVERAGLQDLSSGARISYSTIADRQGRHAAAELRLEGDQA